jgi:hypothetical protein
VVFDVPLLKARLRVFIFSVFSDIVLWEAFGSEDFRLDVLPFSASSDALCEDDELTGFLGRFWFAVLFLVIDSDSLGPKVSG